MSCTGSGVPFWPICIWSCCWHRHCFGSSDERLSIQRLFGSSSSHGPRSPRSPVHLLTARSQAATSKFRTSSLRPHKMVDCAAVSATPQTFQPVVHVLAELCAMTTSHLSFTEHQKMLSSPSMPSVSPSMPSVLRCSVRVSTSAHVACRNARAQRKACESKGEMRFRANLQHGCTRQSMNFLHRSLPAPPLLRCEGLGEVAGS